MTKDTYFDMCEQLGQEPIEEEIPMDLSDFDEFVQQCFLIYRYLTDIWEPMGGSYLGKNYAIVFELMNVYRIDHGGDRLLTLEILQMMDSIRSKIISDKQKAKSPAAK